MDLVAQLHAADQRIEAARDEIHIQGQRITQMELDGRDATDAIKRLSTLNHSLRETIARRDQIIRELDHHPRLGIRRRRS
jgi:hypothetical protein